MVKAQAMRGSPYFKPFEKEVLGWESQLIRIEESIKAWLEVQKKWLYMEGMFAVEEIVRLLPNESALFKEVDNSWKSIMESINKDPRVLKTAGEEGMLEQLKKSLEIIVILDQGIAQYVDNKKLLFPRFFFLSNTEILRVLSETKDPTKVMPYCQKIFEGIQRLEFNDISAIQAMISPTNERVSFLFQIQPREAKGCVEKWLTELENQMCGTLQQQMITAKDAFVNAKQESWLQDWPAQVILAVQHHLWTSDIQEAIKGGEQALKEQSIKLKNDVAAMIDYLKTNVMSESILICVKSLIIQQLYFKEVTDKIYQERITSENDFSWSLQIKMHLVENELQLSMFNVNINYRYEYIGSTKRLVMSPSTHEGILGLALAFNQHYFGCISGPCDVGKSSLGKELASYIGTMYRTFSGSDRNTVTSIANFLSGVASSGCWAVLEDFNRSSSDIMSYMSVFIDKLRQCNLAEKENITLDDGNAIPVEQGYFIMKTAHTSYMGRNKIPESLKVLFRSITLVKPNLEMIIKLTLIAYGFRDYAKMSNQLVNFVALFKSQFREKKQYQLGLRRIEIILEIARCYIKEEENLLEEIAIINAIKQDLTPTLGKREMDIVHHIMCSVFGSQKLSESRTESNLNCSQLDLAERCSTILDRYQSMILIGPTYSGKTSILKQTEEKRKVKKVAIINPKSLDKDQLFGVKSDTGWIDGMLSKTLNRIVNNDEENWIIFDGPLDHNWIENLNCMLDFKKMFYFDSGETVNISTNTKIIFECSDLDKVTPATISRCGIISVPLTCLPWQAIFSKWFERIQNESWIEGHDTLLKELFEWILPPLLKLLETSKVAASVTPNNLVQCSLDLFERILVDALPNLKERKYLRGWLQAAVVYGSIWSIGGCLGNEDERIKFDNGVREVLFAKNTECPLPPSLNGKFDALPPVEGVIFDFLFDFKARGQWKHWNDVIKNTDIPDAYDVSNLLIPTIDSCRYTNILESMLKMKKPFMLIGPRGTGKSTYITNFLQQELNEEHYEHHILNFTPSITPKIIYSSFVSHLNKKKQRIYGTKKNTNFVMYLDNFGYPVPDQFGDQNPHEFIHLFLDHKFMFDFDEYHECQLENTNIVCSTNLNPGMNQVISSRILRHFHAISCTYPSDESLQKIFATKLNIFLKTRSFQPEASGIVGPMVQSTIFIHNELRSNLKQIPSKPHYIFNVRDIANVFEGCMLLPKELSDNKKLFTRLWVHETLRIFNDRLVTPEDTSFLFEKIKHCVKVIFRENFDSAFEHLGKVDGYVTETNLRNLTFGNFIKVEDKMFYQEITSFDEFSKQTKQKLKLNFDQNPSNKFTFDLFRYSMENISKVCRILSQERANMILLGEAGTGRELITRVASIMKDALYYTPILTADFKFKDWRKDFKELLKNAGGIGKCCILFINLEVMNDEMYTDDINNFLTNSELPDLFSVEELYEITEQVHNYLKKSKESEAELSPAQLYEKFKERCRANLHIIMKISLKSNLTTMISRKYPKILDASTVCVFKQWPDDALQKASESFFEELPVSREERKNLISCMKEIYYEMLLAAKKTNESSNHCIEITPSSFLACTKYFANLFQAQLAKITSRKKALDDIINKYDWIKTEISKMEEDIAEIYSQEEQLDIAFKDLEIQITEENLVLKKYEEQFKVEEEKLLKEQIALDGVREICENEFKEVNGKISNCITYLKTLTQAEIQQSCQLKKPSATLKRTMAAICILLEVEPDMIPDPSSKKKDAEIVADYWGPGKRLLQDPEFVEKLELLDKENVQEDKLTILRNDYVNSDFDPGALAKSSPVGEVLCRWVKLVEEFITVDEANQDKKENLHEAEIKYDNVRKIYYEKKTLVDDQQEHIKEIYQQMNENKEKKKEQIEELNFIIQKKRRGEELWDILQEEFKWWEEQKQREEKYMETLIGNIVLITTLMFYLGALPEENRKESHLIIENTLIKWKLPFSDEDFRFSMFLSPTDSIEWELLGLPRVKYYITNALLMKITQRWPMVIDPDNQTSKWIKKVMRDKHIICIENKDKNLVVKVTEAVQEGYPVLIENVSFQINKLLDRLIKREFFNKEGSQFVDIDGNHIKVHNDFQLILSSKSDNVQFPSYFQSNLLFINCIPTREGLEDYLLRMVMSKERPDIGQKTDYSSKRYCETINFLEKNRKNIMKVLLNTDGNILEQEIACKEIKNNLSEIKNCLVKKAKLEVMQNEINEINDSYMPTAKHGAALLNTIKKLETVNAMYKYSFDWFMTLFQSSIENSNKSKILNKRVRFLSDHLTYNCFVQVSQSLYLEDKQTFSFMLCLDLMLFRGVIVENEINILLQTPPVAEKENPYPKWLANHAWDYICNLEKVKTFEGIVDDFCKNEEKWKCIFDAAEPDDLPFHQPWETKLMKFHKLIIIKILRPDKLIEILESFISENLGYKFVETIPTDLGRILADSGTKTPVFLLLSEKRHPIEMIRKLRKGRHNDKTNGLNIFSLLTCNQNLILSSIELSLKDGSWVVIQNCHYCQEAKENLEQIFALISNCGDVNEDFRVWFTSEPVSFLGSLVPGNSIKFVMEPAKELKDQMLYVMQNTFVTKELFENSVHGKETSFSKLLYAIVFMILKFRGRNLFQCQGWSLKTSFTVVDAECAINTLRDVLQMFEGINFLAINFLIRQCNLINRTEDEQDQRLINILMEDIINEDVLTVNRFRLSDSPHLFVPNKILYGDFIDVVINLPLKTEFDVFNVTAFSEREKCVEEAKALMKSLKKTYKQYTETTENITNFLTEILEKKKNLDEEKEGNDLDWVLREEILQYIFVKDYIVSEVRRLELQLIGEHFLDPKSEYLFGHLSRSTTPPEWIKLAELGIHNSHKFLDAIFGNLNYLLTLNFSEGIDLSAFMEPLRLIEGAKMCFCEKENIPYSQVGINVFFCASLPTDFIQTHESLFIKGLELEYANFNFTKGLLEHCNQCCRQTIPYLQIKFVDISVTPASDPAEQLFNCPVYVTPIRTFTNGTSSLVTYLSIPSAVPSSELIRAGAAMIIRAAIRET